MEVPSTSGELCVVAEKKQANLSRATTLVNVDGHELSVSFFRVWDGLGSPGEFSDEQSDSPEDYGTGMYTPRLSRNLSITLKIRLSFFMRIHRKNGWKKRKETADKKSRAREATREEIEQVGFLLSSSNFWC